MSASQLLATYLLSKTTSDPPLVSFKCNDNGRAVLKLEYSSKAIVKSLGHQSIHNSFLQQFSKWLHLVALNALVPIATAKTKHQNMKHENIILDLLFDYSLIMLTPTMQIWQNTSHSNTAAFVLFIYVLERPQTIYQERSPPSVSFSQTTQDISVANIQKLFESISTRGGHRDASQLLSEHGDSLERSSSHTIETQPRSDMSANDENEQPQQNQDCAVNPTAEEEPQSVKSSSEIQAEVNKQFEAHHRTHQLGSSIELSLTQLKILLFPHSSVYKVIVICSTNYIF